MRLFRAITGLFILVTSVGFSQQLIINEISQGTNSKEYIELVVVGTPTCQTPAPCADLRGLVLDDNNGYFASGAGTGIATGAIRFSSSNFWSCVPQGTLIVIYNDGDINPAVPADDVSLTDNNCRLVLPVSSMLIEGQSSSPNTSTPSYPTSANWIAGGGLWTQIGMANGGDSFQLLNSINDTSPSHAISWGNNVSNTQITFPTATAKVFSLMNSTSNDWLLQANWIAGDVGVNETPGAPNSTENSAWIGSMNPNCGVGNPIDIQILESTLTCSNNCDGTLMATASGGVGPYSYSWSDGSLGSSISDLCAGTYSVTVIDQNGCSNTLSGNVAGGYTPPSITINTNSPYTTQDGSDALNASPAGGFWSSNCGNCLSNTGVFSPQISGIGNFTVCYIGYNGACSDTLCTTIIVSDCNTPPLQNAVTPCILDSLLLNGNYYFNDTIVQFDTVDNNGCLQNTITTIDFILCDLSEPNIILPNIFTPNGDNNNDLWHPEIISGFLNEGVILNRWGNVVAKLQEDQLFWDGKINGEPASEGVYFVKITLSSSSGISELFQSYIHLIR